MFVALLIMSYTRLWPRFSPSQDRGFQGTYHRLSALAPDAYYTHREAYAGQGHPDKLNELLLPRAPLHLLAVHITDFILDDPSLRLNAPSTEAEVKPTRQNSS